jgi:hypothetical protein
MIPFALITIGLILTISGIHQLCKPNIHRVEYENQIGFIICGVIFVGLGVLSILLTLNN